MAAPLPGSLAALLIAYRGALEAPLLDRASGLPLLWRTMFKLMLHGEHSLLSPGGMKDVGCQLAAACPRTERRT